MIKKEKTYLIGHLDCKTNQVGIQTRGDEKKTFLIGYLDCKTNQAGIQVGGDD